MQLTNYRPFGMPSTWLEEEDGIQPYKYNGKEYDQMHGLNQYDYHARQQDPSGIRFTSIDPLAEKYYSWSPYVYCMNNPLKYIDPTGMYWVNKEDEKYAGKLSEAMKARRDSEQKSMDKNYQKYKLATIEGKDTSKLIADMKKSNDVITDMNAGISELAEMGNAENSQAFTFTEISGEVGGTEKRADGVIEMSIVGSGSIANGIHESSHGYDLYKYGMYNRSDYLSKGETKAYKREFAYAGKVSAPSYWGSVKQLSDITYNWVLGIRNNGVFIYGKILMGERYDADFIKQILDDARK